MQANYALQTNQSQKADESMATWPDDALVLWISDKQPDASLAFSVLVARHRPWILRRCLFRLGNHHDAEDASQDIVMRVYANLHQFQGRSQFKTWLNVVIDNYCNSFALRNARYATTEHIEQLIERHEQQETADPYCVLAEQAVVRRVLASLPENARQVLSLRFYGEYSLEEMARILCLTLSATKARLYRALEQLKNLYQRVDDGWASPCLA
ncbi:MAG: RNA polymerase sigma factor [Gammaproteobacteria bacterium]